MKRLFFTIAMMGFLSPSFAIAQTEKWNIILSTSDTVFQVTLEGLIWDSLIVEHGGIFQRIPVGSIEKMIVKKSRFWESSGVGLLFGALVGIAVAEIEAQSAEYPNLFLAQGRVIGAVVGGFAGFVLGGAIGAELGIDKEYDFSAVSIDNRLIQIRSFIEESNRNKNVGGGA